jgi:acyl-CoA dehydrogenase
MAIAHAKRRETFGVPLSERQAIQWMLADAEIEIRAARWLVWEGAWKADRGEDFRVEASIARFYSSEVLGRVIDAAVQIQGGYGVAKGLLNNEVYKSCGSCYPSFGCESTGGWRWRGQFHRPNGAG